MKLMVEGFTWRRVVHNATKSQSGNSQDKTRLYNYFGFLSRLLICVAGIEVLNGAIDLLSVRIPRKEWTFVDITVAPSTITVTEHEVGNALNAFEIHLFIIILKIQLKIHGMRHHLINFYISFVFLQVPDKTIAECRVRFLSFLGISLKNIRLVEAVFANQLQQAIHGKPFVNNFSNASNSICTFENSIMKSTFENLIMNSQEIWYLVFSGILQ